MLAYARYGFYFYCDKNCTRTSTWKVYRILHQIICRHGLEVFRMPVVCPTCSSETQFYSYVPQMVFETRERKLCEFVDYWGIGLSHFPRLDVCLSDLYPDNVVILPPQEEAPARWANICPGCGAELAGGLETLVSALLDAAKNNSLDRYRTGKSIPVSNESLPYFEFACVSDEMANKKMRQYECDHRGIEDSEINWATYEPVNKQGKG